MPLDLSNMTNLSLVEYIKNNTAANAVELELAERLGEAINELDQLCKDIASLQAAKESTQEPDDGANPRR